MQLDKAIKERHCVRKFSEKKPNWRKIIECIDSVRYSPMAGNNFTLKIILVSDKEKINKIAEACQQDFIKQAHYVVVFCSISERPNLAYNERAKIYVRQQAGAAMQNFFLRIQEEGLATCWVGHFVDEQIKRELKIPAKAQLEAVFPIGYEFEKYQRKKKIDLDNILYFDRYENKQMKHIKKLDV